MLDSVVGVAGKVLDKFVEDKDLKAKLQHELDMQLHNANLAQIEVNKEQAKTRPCLSPVLDQRLCGCVV